MPADAKDVIRVATPPLNVPVPREDPLAENVTVLVGVSPTTVAVSVMDAFSLADVEDACSETEVAMGEGAVGVGLVWLSRAVKLVPVKTNASRVLSPGSAGAWLLRRVRKTCPGVWV